MEKIKEFVSNHKKICIGAIGLLIIALGVLLYFTVFYCNHYYRTKKTEWPTCTTEGTKTYSCKKCGKEYTKTLAIDKDRHEYVTSVEKEATCTTDGTEKMTCKLCGNSYTETISKHHDWETATCASPQKCKICGATEGEKSENHNFVSGKCSVCGKLDYKVVNSNGVNFKLPNEDVTVSYYQTSFNFTDISVKFERTTYGYSKFYVYYSGEKTSGLSKKCVFFKYSLYDSDGYVISSDSAHTEDLEQGEKVKNKMFEIRLDHTNGSDLVAGRTYELKLSDYN